MQNDVANAFSEMRLAPDPSQKETEGIVAREKLTRQK